MKRNRFIRWLFQRHEFSLGRTLKIRLNWHARSGGGLIVGIRIGFPVSVCDRIEELEGTEEEHWKILSGGLCLLVATISFDFQYGHRRDPIWQQLEPK